MIPKSRNGEETEVPLQVFVNAREFGDNITTLSVYASCFKILVSEESIDERVIPVAIQL